MIYTPDELTKKIFMYLDDGYDEEEIANDLGLSVEQVKQLIFEEENGFIRRLLGKEEDA